MILLGIDKCKALVATMVTVWKVGYQDGAAGERPHSGFTQSATPGCAWAYQNGYEAGARDRACIAQAADTQHQGARHG